MNSKSEIKRRQAQGAPKDEGEEPKEQPRPLSGGETNPPPPPPEDGGVPDVPKSR